jgi:hypothetical protein
VLKGLTQQKRILHFIEFKDSRQGPFTIIMVIMKLMDITENIGKSVIFFVFLVTALLLVTPRAGYAQAYRTPEANTKRLAGSASLASTLYDPTPTPYCNVVLSNHGEYINLENQVHAANPAGTTLAQFVLEAFAEANSNNSLLDSQSATDVVTALQDLQSMWVPSALNFKSNYSDSKVTNTNTVEFVIEQLIQIPYRFPKLLAQYGPVGQSGTIENLLSALLAEGQLGEINHQVDFSYTNVFLAKVCNLVLIGQGPTDGSGNVLVAVDTDVLDAGRTLLMEWASTVRVYGVHEFLTATYTGLDLEMLGNIQLFANDPGISALAQQGYKEQWTDMYVNWYNQDQRLGGTHSRTYEFLTDEDRKTDRFLYAASNPTVASSPAWPNLLTARTLIYWRGQDYVSYILPPPSDVPTRFPVTVPVNTARTVLRDFGFNASGYNPAWMYGENYMGNPSGTGGLTYPFSVGSAESIYPDPTFEGLTIMLPGSGNTTNVNFNMQGRKDYYLQQAVASKSETLEPYIACAQSGAETLFFATSNAQQDSGAEEVASTIIIPNSAQVWVGNSSSPENLTPGQSVSLSPGSTIFIQVTNPGQSDALVTGIRFLLSTDMDGNATTLSLVNDGSQYNALRISCVHSGTTPSSGNAVIALWTRTGYSSNLTTNFNSFRSAMTSASVTSTYDPSSGEVTLSVPGWNGFLGVQANTITQTTTSISGTDLDSAFTLPLLSVNGTEYLSSTIQDWTSQDIGDATGGEAALRSSDGLYTGQVQIVGAGSDIWGTSDGFQFYYQQLTGNGTVIGRLTNFPTGTGTDPWAKAGLMMRNDLTPGSMNAYISLDGTHGQRFSVRPSTKGVSTRAGNATTTVPYWFKITRVGNTFTGYSSRDGQTWTQVGAPATIPMNATIYVGAAVTSHNASNPITTGFDNLGILQQ